MAIGKPSDRWRGRARASDELIERVRSKGRTIEFAASGSEEERYLDYMGANANAGGADLRHILLRPDPRLIEILEEFLHGTQMHCGVVDRLGINGAEAHVVDFMLRHRSLLHISYFDAGRLARGYMESYDA